MAGYLERFPAYAERYQRLLDSNHIKMLHLTDETFDVPEDFDLDKLLKHSFKVMKDELYTVRVRISPAWSRYVGERIWHESQRIQNRWTAPLRSPFMWLALTKYGSGY